MNEYGKNEMSSNDVVARELCVVVGRIDRLSFEDDVQTTRRSMGLGSMGNFPASGSK